MRFSDFLNQHTFDNFSISEADINKYWPQTISEENVLMILDGLGKSIKEAISSKVKLEFETRGGSYGETVLKRNKYKTTEDLEAAQRLFDNMKHLACLMTYSKVYEKATSQDLKMDNYKQDPADRYNKYVQATDFKSDKVVDNLSDKYAVDRNKAVAAQFKFVVSSYCKEYAENSDLSWFTEIIDSLKHFFQNGYLEIDRRLKKELGHE